MERSSHLVVTGVVATGAITDTVAMGAITDAVAMAVGAVAMVTVVVSSTSVLEEADGDTSLTSLMVVLPRLAPAGGGPPTHHRGRNSSAPAAEKMAAVSATALRALSDASRVRGRHSGERRDWHCQAKRAICAHSPGALPPHRNGVSRNWRHASSPGLDRRALRAMTPADVSSISDRSPTVSSQYGHGSHNMVTIRGRRCHPGMASVSGGP